MHSWRPCSLTFLSCRVTSYFWETFSTLRFVKCSGSINMAIVLLATIRFALFIMQQCIIPCHHSTKAKRWSTSANCWARRRRCTTGWVEQNKSNFEICITLWQSCFQTSQQWQDLHRKHTVVQGNRALVAGDFYHLVNHLYHKGNKMPVKCLNNKPNTVCSFMYDYYIKLGVLNHKHVPSAEKAPLSPLPQHHLSKFTKVLHRHCNVDYVRKW